MRMHYNVSDHALPRCCKIWECIIMSQTMHCLDAARYENALSCLRPCTAQMLQDMRMHYHVSDHAPHRCYKIWECIIMSQTMHRPDATRYENALSCLRPCTAQMLQDMRMHYHVSDHALPRCYKIWECIIMSQTMHRPDATRYENALSCLRPCTAQMLQDMRMHYHVSDHAPHRCYKIWECIIMSQTMHRPDATRYENALSCLRPCTAQMLQDMRMHYHVSDHAPHRCYKIWECIIMSQTMHRTDATRYENALSCLRPCTAQMLQDMRMHYHVSDHAPHRCSLCAGLLATNAISNLRVKFCGGWVILVIH